MGGVSANAAPERAEESSEGSAGGVGGTAPPQITPQGWGGGRASQIRGVSGSVLLEL